MPKEFGYDGNVKGTILQSVVGLLLGACIGAVVGFITFAILGRGDSQRGGMIMFAPSGPLALGIIGAVLMGVAGLVIGLITGVFRLRPTWAAAVGVLIFAILSGRSLYSTMRSEQRFQFIDITYLIILLDLVFIGVSVALSLGYFFAGRPR